jgi:hypothetical protein
LVDSAFKATTKVHTMTSETIHLSLPSSFILMSGRNIRNVMSGRNIRNIMSGRNMRNVMSGRNKRNVMSGRNMRNEHNRWSRYTDIDIQTYIFWRGGEADNLGLTDFAQHVAMQIFSYENKCIATFTSFKRSCCRNNRIESSNFYRLFCLQTQMLINYEIGKASFCDLRQVYISRVTMSWTTRSRLTWNPSSYT